MDVWHKTKIHNVIKGGGENENHQKNSTGR